MDEKERQSIIGSIRKWECITSDFYSIKNQDMMLEFCELCYLSGACKGAWGLKPYAPKCDLCPLWKAGNGCLSKTIPDQTLPTVFERLDREFDKRIEYIDIDLCLELCEQMYENVCALLPDDDPYWEDCK